MKICVSLISLCIYAFSAQAAYAPTKNISAENPSLNEGILGMVAKLERCESGSRNICVIDTNGKKSCGVLQYQLSTYKSFIKRYKLLPEAEDHEIENMWLDPDMQRLVTYKALEEDTKNLSHWYNCSKRMKLM
jgi:hypothetical protein